jgi:membrane-anchored protein YejM (alkaline phosphatase superfamily)
MILGLTNAFEVFVGLQQFSRYLSIVLYFLLLHLTWAIVLSFTVMSVIPWDSSESGTIYFLVSHSLHPPTFSLFVSLSLYLSISLPTPLKGS